MPTSMIEGKTWTTENVAKRAHDITTVLDIGAGEGTYATLLRPILPHALFIGVEIHKPYIQQFGLLDKYDLIDLADVREYPAETFAKDLVIFGDVLEHMHRHEAVEVLHRAQKTARHVLVSLPIVHMEQGAINGNEHERHLHHWSYDEMRDVLLDSGGSLIGLHGTHLGVYLWTREE